jgi:hypothetical protein
MRLPAGLDVTLVKSLVLRCNYDLSKFPFITNCQVVLYVVQVWLFENGPSRSGVNRGVDRESYGSDRYSVL